MRPKKGEALMEEAAADPRGAATDNLTTGGVTTTCIPRAPAQLLRDLVLLVREARTPDLSVKGRAEGPHCPLLGGVSSRGRPAHKCLLDRPECVGASAYCQQAARLWLMGVPVCIDVLLLPRCNRHGDRCNQATAQGLEDMYSYDTSPAPSAAQHKARDESNMPASAREGKLGKGETFKTVESCGGSAREKYPTNVKVKPGEAWSPPRGYEERGLLLERWTIEARKRFQEEGIAATMLMQAVRSYLHFSQISSWLYSSAGKLPGLIVYRVNAPREDLGLDLHRLSDSHQFPVCSTGPCSRLLVTVASLPRQPSIPRLPASDCGSQESSVAGQGFTTDNESLAKLLTPGKELKSKAVPKQLKSKEEFPLPLLSCLPSNEKIVKDSPPRAGDFESARGEELYPAGGKIRFQDLKVCADQSRSSAICPISGQSYCESAHKLRRKEGEVAAAISVPNSKGDKKNRETYLANEDDEISDGADEIGSLASSVGSHSTLSSLDESIQSGRDRGVDPNFFPGPGDFPPPVSGLSQVSNKSANSGQSSGLQDVQRASPNRASASRTSFVEDSVLSHPNKHCPGFPKLGTCEDSERIRTRPARVAKKDGEKDLRIEQRKLNEGDKTDPCINRLPLKKQGSEPKIESGFPVGDHKEQKRSVANAKQSSQNNKKRQRRQRQQQLRRSKEEQVRQLVQQQQQQQQQNFSQQRKAKAHTVLSSKALPTSPAQPSKAPPTSPAQPSKAPPTTPVQTSTKHNKGRPPSCCDNSCVESDAAKLQQKNSKRDQFRRLFAQEKSSPRLSENLSAVSTPAQQLKWEMDAQEGEEAGLLPGEQEARGRTLKFETKLSDGRKWLGTCSDFSSSAMVSCPVSKKAINPAGMTTHNDIVRVRSERDLGVKNTTSTQDFHFTKEGQKSLERDSAVNIGYVNKTTSTHDFPFTTGRQKSFDSAPCKNSNSSKEWTETKGAKSLESMMPNMSSFRQLSVDVGGGHSPGERPKVSVSKSSPLDSSSSSSSDTTPVASPRLKSTLECKVAERETKTNPKSLAKVVGQKLAKKAFVSCSHDNSGNGFSHNSDLAVAGSDCEARGDDDWVRSGLSQAWSETVLGRSNLCEKSCVQDLSSRSSEDATFSTPIDSTPKLYTHSGILSSCGKSEIRSAAGSLSVSNSSSSIAQTQEQSTFIHETNEPRQATQSQGQDFLIHQTNEPRQTTQSQGQDFLIRQTNEPRQTTQSQGQDFLIHQTNGTPQPISDAQANSRRIFQQHPLPIMSYDATSESFKSVGGDWPGWGEDSGNYHDSVCPHHDLLPAGEGQTGPVLSSSPQPVLHSPKVLFSSDLPSMGFNVDGSLDTLHLAAVEISPGTVVGVGFGLPEGHQDALLPAWTWEEDEKICRKREKKTAESLVGKPNNSKISGAESLVTKDAQTSSTPADLRASAAWVVQPTRRQLDYSHPQEHAPLTRFHDDHIGNIPTSVKGLGGRESRVTSKAIDIVGQNQKCSCKHLTADLPQARKWKQAQVLETGHQEDRNLHSKDCKHVPTNSEKNENMILKSRLPSNPSTQFADHLLTPSPSSTKSTLSSSSSTSLSLSSLSFNSAVKTSRDQTDVVQVSPSSISPLLSISHQTSKPNNSVGTSTSSSSTTSSEKSVLDVIFTASPIPNQSPAGSSRSSQFQEILTHRGDNCRGLSSNLSQGSSPASLSASDVNSYIRPSPPPQTSGPGFFCVSNDQATDSPPPKTSGLQSFCVPTNENSPGKNATLNPDDPHRPDSHSFALLLGEVIPFTACQNGSSSPMPQPEQNLPGGTFVNPRRDEVQDRSPLGTVSPCKSSKDTRQSPSSCRSFWKESDVMKSPHDEVQDNSALETVTPCKSRKDTRQPVSSRPFNSYLCVQENFSTKSGCESIQVSNEVKPVSESTVTASRPKVSKSGSGGNESFHLTSGGDNLVLNSVDIGETCDTNGSSREGAETKFSDDEKAGDNDVVFYLPGASEDNAEAVQLQSETRCLCLTSALASSQINSVEPCSLTSTMYTETNSYKLGPEKCQRTEKPTPSVPCLVSNESERNRWDKNNDRSFQTNSQSLGSSSCSLYSEPREGENRKWLQNVENEEKDVHQHPSPLTHGLEKMTSASVKNGCGSGWSSVPPQRTVSTPSRLDSSGETQQPTVGQGHTSSTGQLNPLLPPRMHQSQSGLTSDTGLRRLALRSTSMVFNSRTGLPTQSSPAPLKRRPSARFDYDASLVGVRALHTALSCSGLASDTGSGSEADLSQVKGLSTSAPASSNCLLGNFEESLLNGRISPAGVVEGFSCELGASGSFCPSHLKLPITAFFFSSLSDDNAPSPYLGHVSLEAVGKRGYHIPKQGTVQVTLFNPSNTVVKMFVVRYDLSDMPPSSRTFLRQRTVYSPVKATDDFPSYLRYLIHLRFASSQSGKIYLHTDIRLIFARHKLEIDASTVEYQLKSSTEGPHNPKYSPKR